MYLIFLFQVYVIEVSIGPYHWTVRHRYSEFFELHEKVNLDLFMLYIMYFKVAVLNTRSLRHKKKFTP